MALLQESARRTFDRTGILMRKPAGFTVEGLQKKATGRALFSKLMYLADLEQLLPGSNLPPSLTRRTAPVTPRSPSLLRPLWCKKSEAWCQTHVALSNF
jgi:hypothetical protein